MYYRILIYLVVINVHGVMIDYFITFIDSDTRWNLLV